MDVIRWLVYSVPLLAALRALVSPCVGLSYCSGRELPPGVPQKCIAVPGLPETACTRVKAYIGAILRESPTSVLNPAVSYTM